MPRVSTRKETNVTIIQLNNDEEKALVALLNELTDIEDEAAGPREDVFWVAGNVHLDALNAVRAIVRMPALGERE